MKLNVVVFTVLALFSKSTFAKDCYEIERALPTDPAQLCLGYSDEDGLEWLPVKATLFSVDHRKMAKLKLKGTPFKQGKVMLAVMDAIDDTYHLQIKQVSGRSIPSTAILTMDGRGLVIPEIEDQFDHRRSKDPCAFRRCR